MRYKPIHHYLFAKNRQKLARLLPAHSLVIVFSNDEMPRTADQFFPYRQNSDLFYLTGIEQSKTILCLAPDMHLNQYREILFIENTSDYYKTWTGNKLSKEQALELSGISNISWLDEFENLLNDLMQEAKHVYISFHETARSFDEVPLRDIRYAEKIRYLFPLHHYERLSPLMAELRMVKEPEELEQIKKAISITEITFRSILSSLKPGIKEYEIEAEIISGFIRNASTGHAFHPIVASGANANVLHYTDNSNTCKDGELVLVDFGAEYGNYNADITRTLPVNGTFSLRQRSVYEAVLRLHNLVASMMVPGTSLEKINAEMAKHFEKELIGLNLLTEEQIFKENPEKPAYKKYFMHGIGHFLGLDVHDLGSKQEKLREGMVITCEPGIYIREEGLGIRLENNFLITEHGNINLSKSIPIDPDEIERLMKK